MKKRLISLSLTFLFLLSLLPVFSLTAQAAESVTNRNDGVWFYPVDAQYAVSDWAGCTGWGPCKFHNVNHYGDPDHNNDFNRWLGHQGIDIAATYVPVYASRTGVVRSICYFDASGRGTTIALEHAIGNGYSFYSIYQHLSGVNVSEGQSVSMGNRIATAGNHMHFAILLAPSNTYMDNTNINAVEGRGWVTQLGDTQTGRIVCNPSSSSDPVLQRAPGAVKEALLAHMGSVRYTFNKNTPPAPPINPPTNTWLTTSSETGNSSTTITLNWGANRADKYWLGIYRNGVSENELYISKQLTSTSFSQTFPSGTYYAVIAAINSGGETKASVSFKITENGSLKNVAVSDGLYILESKLDSNKAADVYSGSKDSETNIELWAKNNKNNQKFKIEKDGNSYKMAAYHSGLSMDVRGGSAASGTNIQQYRFCEDNNLAQKWVFEDAGNGYVYIRSMLGTYVDIYSSLTDDGTNIWAFSFNGTDAQKWKLVPTSCAHTYGNWSVTKSASCTESGTETRVCSLCQKTETRTINALGHSYSNGVCSKCGERENTNTPVTPNPPVSPDSGKKEVHFPKITIYFQGQFSDVPTDQWFTNNVANAFSLGLMKGNSATTFNPYGDVTIAEAVAMAARIHSIYTTGSENFTQGTPWYQCYLDYAYQNKIISYAYYNCDVKNKATRAQFAEIFAAALPDEALSIKNSVSDNAIPDVKMKDSYSAPVYKLYRAGILAGGDAKGTFSPGTFITRAECATIVARMADSDNRVSFSLT